jgi:branched-subunit amino acid transport protein AzlD
VENSRIIYLIAAVATGWAVTYTLRALPFILFSRKARELPPWAGRLGNLISPLIIAALILYSYSALEWRTVSPHLAGTLTVALHLRFLNPLASIVAGTALYMALLRV